MNIKKFALGGFTQTTDNSLLSKGNTVLQAMNNNAHFPEPNPALEVVEALFQDFQAKLAVAQKKGGPEDTAIKNESRRTLVHALKQLAFYVSSLSEGNLEMLLSSGFDLSGYPQSTVPPSLVTGVTLKDGRQSGQIRLDFDKQTQALLYEYRYAQEAATPEQMIWTDPPLMTTSSRNNILAPLVPLTRYYVQVRAVNGLGKSEWSEPVSYIGR
jgi:hypothetical protein